MRPLHASLIVLALVLVAGLAWRLVDSGNLEPAEPAGPAPTALPAADEPADDPVQRPRERPAAESEAARSSRAARPAEVASATEARPSGPRLVGRIVDGSGRPVADARVRVVHAQFGGAVVRFGHGRGDADDAVVTDERGAFTVPGVASGTNVLFVNASGFEPIAGRQIQVPSGGEHDVGDVELERGVVLAGRVVDPNGAPVASATLSPYEPASGGLRLFARDDAGEPLATTAPDGTFRVDELAAGPWTLLVRSETHPSTVATGMTDRPGEERVGIEIVLEPGAAISGRVVDAPEASAGKLTVRALPAGEDGTSQIDIHDPTPFEVRTAEVAADGRFRVRGLHVERTYRLSVDEESGVTFGPIGRSVSEAKVARSGDRDVELSYRPEAALTFQVVDAATGEPIEEFHVSAGIGWARPLFSEVGRPRTRHEDGHVRFGGLRPQSKQDLVRLEIEATGYETYTRDDIRLAPASEYELGVIELEPTSVLSVTVLDDATGEPIDGARVTLARATEDGPGNVREVRMRVGAGDGDPELRTEGRRVATTGADGVCELSSYEGEACTLTAKASGYAPRRTEELVLPVGRVHSEVVRLDRGGTVVVTVVDAQDRPVAAEKVRHRAPTSDPGMMMMGGGRSEVTDAEGRATFDHLEPGLHAFALGGGDDGLMMLPGSGGGRMAFRVETSGLEADGDEWNDVLVDAGGRHELRLVAPVRLTLAGTILEAGRPLAGASLSLREPSADDDFPLPGMLGGGGPTARTNGSGEYEFANVEEGSYELVVEHPSRAMPIEFDVVVAGGRERFDVDLPLTIVEGTIRDPFGEPVAGVSVRARKSDGPQRQMMFISRFSGGGDATVTAGLGDSGGRVTTDAEGRYELRGVRADVPLVIHAEGSGMQPVDSEELELFEGQVKRDVDLEMVEGGELVVTVLTTDGSPGEQVLVQASYIGDEFDRVRPETSMTGPNGLATFDGLVPGPWRVTANALRPGGMDFDEPDAESSVEVEQGGEAPVELVVP